MALKYFKKKREKCVNNYCKKIYAWKTGYIELRFSIYLYYVGTYFIYERIDLVRAFLT